MITTEELLSLKEQWQGYLDHVYWGIYHEPSGLTWETPEMILSSLRGANFICIKMGGIEDSWKEERLVYCINKPPPRYKDEKLEMDWYRKLSNYKSTFIQQVWNDIATFTGYTSYGEYFDRVCFDKFSVQSKLVQRLATYPLPQAPRLYNLED